MNYMKGTALEVCVFKSVAAYFAMKHCLFVRQCFKFAIVCAFTRTVLPTAYCILDAFMLHRYKL